MIQKVGKTLAHQDGSGAMLPQKNILEVPYCTPLWSFILGFDVLKNIYLQYKHQKPYQYIFTALVKTG